MVPKHPPRGYFSRLAHPSDGPPAHFLASGAAAEDEEGAPTGPYISGAAAEDEGGGPHRPLHLLLYHRVLICILCLGSTQGQTCLFRVYQELFNMPEFVSP